MLNTELEIPLEAQQLDILLLGVAGSTAFGLNHADSDIDLHGTYCAPFDDVLGITPVKENYSHRAPDIQMHEIGKFVSLGLKSNPNVLENLWLTDYPVLTQWGQILIDNRKHFLSDRYVRNAYSGYAKSQLSTKSSIMTPKAGRHAIRMLDCAYSLITTGDMVLDRSADRDEIFAVGRLAETDHDAYMDIFKSKQYALESAVSVLPQRPDIELFERMVVTIRKERNRSW